LSRATFGRSVIPEPVALRRAGVRSPPGPSSVGAVLRIYADDVPTRGAETVGERIRRLREERGLSQRELAEPGVSYAYVSRLEAGDRRASLQALRKLAAKLGVTPLYLEVGRDDATCPHCGRAP
jgi:ribosome-binding protein aMBF1 (putative translation factor)